MLRSAKHALQELERARLVERLVQVAALRALDAGRAAPLAGASLKQLGGVVRPALEDVEAALRDTHAASVAVVDEDRRPAGLEVEVGREAADVPAVAHRPEWQERDQRVLCCVERSEKARHLLEAL